MKLDLEKPFFDSLKEGVDYIETTVRSLKQESDNGFPTLEQPLNDEEIIKINQFDDSVKETFADVSTLFNLLMKHPFNLDELDKSIDELKNKLITYENNSGFKEFGYKPFVYITPDKKIKPQTSPQSSSTNGSANVSDTNQDETIKPSLANLLKEKEVDKSKLLRSTFKVTGRKNFDNKRKSIIETAKIPIAHVNLTSNVSTQDGKRYPVMPSSSFLASPNDKDESQDGVSIKYITGCKTSTTNNGIDSTNTSFTNSIADSTVSNKYEASQILVEFTPGLTTTRPKMKPRINRANLRPPLDYRPGKFGNLRSSIDDSRNDSTSSTGSSNNNRTFLKKTRATTPESPVFPWSTAANRIKNINNTYRISPEPRANLRTLDKSTPEEPKSPSEITAIKKPLTGTPEMPSCNIDTALHQRLLAKAKTLRDNVF